MGFGAGEELLTDAGAGRSEPDPSSAGGGVAWRAATVFAVFLRFEVFAAASPV